MEKIILKFKSPKLLNELTKAKELESKNWFYVDGTQLELDINSWEISSKDVSKKINIWMVNEEKYLMKLESDEHDETFYKLDFTFAVSMIGQVADKKDLIKYLKDLEKIYSSSPKNKDQPIDDENENKKDDKESDNN